VRHGAPYDSRVKVVRRDLTLCFVAVVNEDDVDVGARVQLQATQLAHAEHAQLDSLPVGAQRRSQAGREVLGGLGQRHLDDRIGQLGELARGFGELGAAQLGRQHLA
jgi:hypothetical protein